MDSVYTQFVTNSQADMKCCCRPNLLQRIATSDVFRALIDTGALITGYSNQEVAEELLARGLPWCDGVVFLDDADKQQVLVRATGRVVSADQCGVPLERRFAFYDRKSL